MLGWFVVLYVGYNHDDATSMCLYLYDGNLYGVSHASFFRYSLVVCFRVSSVCVSFMRLSSVGSAVLAYVILLRPSLCAHEYGK